MTIAAIILFVLGALYVRDLLVRLTVRLLRRYSRRDSRRA